MKLTIRPHKRTRPPYVFGDDLVVELDGVVLPAVKALTLSVVANEVTTAAITFMPDDVEVDADVLAELTALVDAGA